MKKIWKWILGILLVLVVLAIFIAVPVVLHNTFGVNGSLRAVPNARLWSLQQDDGYGIGRHPMMMGGRGFMPRGGMFMGFGMLFGWLFPLGLLALLVYGAYRLGKGRSTSSTPAPVAPPPPARTCPKCGQAVQDGWNNCANCGKKL